MKVRRGERWRSSAARPGINKQTYYRWKAKFGGLQVDEAKRLRHLEDENRRLKQAVAELTLDKQVLKDLLGRKW